MRFKRMILGKLHKMHRVNLNVCLNLCDRSEIALNGEAGFGVGKAWFLDEQLPDKKIAPAEMFQQERWCFSLLSVNSFL